MNRYESDEFLCMPPAAPDAASKAQHRRFRDGKLFTHVLLFAVALLGVDEIRLCLDSLIDRRPYVMLGLVVLMLFFAGYQHLMKRRWIVSLLIAIPTFAIATVGAAKSFGAVLDLLAGSWVARLVGSMPWMTDLSALPFNGKALVFLALLAVVTGWAMLFPRAFRAILALLLVLGLSFGVLASLGALFKDLWAAKAIVALAEMAVAGVVAGFLDDRLRNSRNH